MRIQIPDHVEQIIEQLNHQGYEAYAVGGCVRDTLLGREPDDWDITTSATPLQVKELFRRTIDTGIQHGTVTVMLGDAGYEVTTYRIDGEYEDGRHPKQVAFTASLLEDLKRRDFTINAMAYNHQIGIVDEFGGTRDLEEGIIRCVGKATERFNEDALRILRAIRFSAQLGFTVESDTWEAITLIAPNLAKVSKERVQIELTKLLLSAHPEHIGQVYTTGIAAYVSPAFAPLPYRQVRIPTTLPAEKYIRWAAFLRITNPETAVQILKDLKLDNDTIGKVKTLVIWSAAAIVDDPAEVRKAMSKMSAEVWDAVCILNEYDDSILALTDEIRAAGDCLTLKQLTVSGNDLVAAGVRPGLRIGEILNQMLDHVLEYPQDNQKDILLGLFSLE